jgi:plasmid stabilization system protein ParE
MLPFRVLREARRELLDAARWYKLNDGLDVARDFGAEYRVQVTRARQLPRSGHPVAEMPPDLDFEVRRYLLQRFPYAVLIAYLPKEVVVVAVAHQRRRPGYWLRRLSKVMR